MSRKVYVNVTVRLIVDADEGVAISDVVSELDYDFRSTMDGADVLDMEIRDHEVVDSK